MHELHASIARNTGQPASTMFILGHTGITFGVAVATHSLSTPSRETKHTRSSLGARIRGQVRGLSKSFDLRLLMIGSLLPDIIYKPLGLLLLSDVYGTGRLFAHSLIFVVAIGLAGLWLHRTHGRNWLLVLAFGSAMHLLLDAMWRTPSILLWPFVGSLPQGGAPEAWFPSMLAAPTRNTSAMVSEIVGLALLIPLIWMVLRGAGLRRFLRHGTVE